LKKWLKFEDKEILQPSLVYRGELSYEREGMRVWGWQDIGNINMPQDKLTHADLSELVNRDDDERAYQFIQSR
jgi:hypothetical protein